MTNLLRHICSLIIVIGSFFPFATTIAQIMPADLSKIILYQDSVFWEAYNACDISKMEAFFTTNMEFYHDKGGVTTSRKKFIRSLRTGLCGATNRRLRRQAIPGSIKVYPLDNYGAILSGEHLFYIREEGKEEKLDGRAKFTHLWQYHKNEWRMHRILSYDHGPAPCRSNP